jgi:UDP-N-acetylglucosamine 2-epimerase
VGLRQKGRERPRNVIDIDPDKRAILAAIEKATSPDFLTSLSGMENPYGDGVASERIVEVLSNLPARAELLMKRAVLRTEQGV